ncbi:MAG: TrkA family potassium uptake protein [Candidatus Krumholzibacteriia bacterium]|nr:TrkA family potassium uptake protein [bacterium]
MGERTIKRAAVVGLGRFGRAVARTLSELGVEVLAVDRELRYVEMVKDDVDLAVCVDATQESALDELDVRNVDLLVVGVGELFEENILITSWAAEAGIPQVITRAGTPVRRRILERVGATRVLFAEQEMGQRLAQNLVRGDALEFVDLPDDYSLRELEVPAPFVGHTLGELGLRRNHGLAVLAVRRITLAEGKSERRVFPVPDGDFRFEAGDRLSVIARNEDFARLKH